MPDLVLIRHGQSEWNLQNRFTGWVDVRLTDQGKAEAKQAGKQIKALNLSFDQAFTSLQSRAIHTLWLALEEMDCCWLPVEKDYRLNERHYGGLTGLNKGETADKHGTEQVKIWRRSYDIPPPKMEEGAEFDLSKDPRYQGISVPKTESLKLTLERVLPYWQTRIAPCLQADKNLLIAAHGNSLRAIVKYVFNVADADITQVEIPTGNPLHITLNADLKPVSAQYLDGQRATELPEI